ncbi:MAG: hypothetical protein AAGL29_08225 [Bacteroidota bacterium]
MRTAKLCWSLGSILVNITIGIYIYLQNNGPSDLRERFQYVNDNWSIYGGHWKAEFLIMILVCIGAFYFAVHLKKIGWVIVSVGQFIILWTYPLMLAGYRNTPFEIANMANQMATITFIFGNLIFFSGLLYLYFKNDIFKVWLRYLSIALSGIATLMFLSIATGLITWSQALVIAPIINVLYLINAYYGFKIDGESQVSTLTN